MRKSFLGCLGLFSLVTALPAMAVSHSFIDACDHSHLTLINHTGTELLVSNIDSYGSIEGITLGQKIGDGDTIDFYASGTSFTAGTVHGDITFMAAVEPVAEKLSIHYSASPDGFSDDAKCSTWDSINLRHSDESDSIGISYDGEDGRNDGTQNSNLMRYTFYRKNA